MTNPILVTALLFVMATALPALAIFYSRPCLETLRQNWWLVLMFLTVNVALKLPMGTPFYHGMEYEDCFVHQAVGREFYYGQTSVQDQGSYVEGIWSVGNLHKGHYYRTFFNPIGYATVIYLAHLLIGDHPSAAHLVSLSASCIAVVVVFLLGSLIKPDRLFPTVAALIYSALPIVNGNAATTSSEVFSSLYVALAILLVHLAFNNEEGLKQRWLAKVTLAAVLSFSVVCRRENNLLLLLTPALFWLAWRSNDSLSKHRWTSVALNSALVLLIPCGFVVTVLRLSANYEQEVAAISANPFALTNFLVLGPALLTALAKPSFYLFFGSALLLAPLVWFWLPALRCVLLALIAYLLTYTFHFRGYYFLQTYQATPFDMVRYLMNVSPLIALASAGAMCLVAKLFKDIVPKWVYFSRSSFALGAISVLIVAFGSTMHWRSEHTREEQQVRVQPVLAAIRHVASQADQPSWVFTSLPCLFQVYSPASLGIVDIDVAAELGSPFLEKILAHGHAYAFFTPMDLSEVDRIRYPKRTRWLETVSKDTVYESPEGSLVKLQID